MAGHRSAVHRSRRRGDRRQRIACASVSARCSCCVSSASSAERDRERRSQISPQVLARSRYHTMMTYKGYVGKVEFDDEAGIFYGEVINLRDVITFQGTSVQELRQAFQDSVDDYLEFCARRGEEAEKPFSGKFVVRVSPDVHRELFAKASLGGQEPEQPGERSASGCRRKGAARISCLRNRPRPANGSARCSSYFRELPTDRRRRCRQVRVCLQPFINACRICWIVKTAATR